MIVDRKHGKNMAMMGVLFMKHQKDGLIDEAAHWAFMQEMMADSQTKYGGHMPQTQEECKAHYAAVNTMSPANEGISFDDFINMKDMAEKLQEAKKLYNKI